MTQVASCFTSVGTELEREGQSPLVAVATYADGKLLAAYVGDPAAGWPYGDVPGWAIPSQGSAETNGGAT